jgi:hypothetical protein
MIAIRLVLVMAVTAGNLDTTNPITPAAYNVLLLLRIGSIHYGWFIMDT